MRHIPKQHQETTRSGLVDSSVNGLHKFASIDPRDKKNYALLVVRQLRARKVDLSCRVSRGGAIFSVGKKDSDKLRPFWDGSRVSGASVCPPPPPTSAHTRCYSWNVRLASSFDEQRGTVRHCLTS